MRPAQAEQNPVITEPTDFYFEFEQTTQFIARTFMIGEDPSDPQLWLYEASAGTLIVSNDDFDGLQSRIELELPAGSYRLRAGTCCWEPDVWRDGVVWNVQYELSFNGLPSPTTTVEASTTTIFEPSTTTSTTTTTTTEVLATTTTTVAPTTTMFVPPIETQPTTTTTNTTSVPSEPTPSVPNTTTSTTIVDTTTTSEVTTSLPQEASTTTTNTPTPTSEPSVTLGTEPPTTSEEPSTTDAPASDVPTTIAVAEILENADGETLTDEEFASVLDQLESGDLSASEIADVVRELLDTDISSDQAAGLASNADVIASLDADTASAVFEALDISEVTEEQAIAIVEAVQSASNEVREAFEESVDIFGGQVDTYIPTGSSVPVRTRRVLIAAALVAAPVATRRSAIR